MKIKRLVTIALAICLTLVFSSSAFAAELPTGNTTISMADSVITPNFASPHPVLYGYTGVAWVTAQPSLLLRTGPGSTYTAVDTVYYGDQLIVSNTSTNNWAYVDYYAWCSGYYLTTTTGDF
jgi:uncharacterized protein YgiM (DUF1202 family)